MNLENQRATAVDKHNKYQEEILSDWNRWRATAVAQGDDAWVRRLDHMRRGVGREPYGKSLKKEALSAHHYKIIEETCEKLEIKCVITRLETDPDWPWPKTEVKVSKQDIDLLHNELQWLHPMLEYRYFEDEPLEFGRKSRHRRKSRRKSRKSRKVDVN